MNRRSPPVVACLVCAALVLGSWPASAALIGPEGRTISLQGLIPLPELARAFAPPGLTGALPPAALSQTALPNGVPGVPATAAAIPAVQAPAALLSPQAAVPPAAASPAAGQGPLAALSDAAAGAADPRASSEKLDAAFDGSGAHARRGADTAPRAPAPPARLPSDALPLPIVTQGADFSCGAAALLAALYYWQVFNGLESELYDMLETTPQHGTEPAKLVEAARAFGLHAEMRQRVTLADLRAALGRGETVIVDFQAWHDGPAHPSWPATWEDGHYAVVAGMDDHYVYLMDPSAGPGYAYVPLAEFLDRWHDYEDRRGPREENHQLAIFLKGKTPMKTFPGPLVPVQ